MLLLLLRIGTSEREYYARGEKRIAAAASARGLIYGVGHRSKRWPHNGLGEGAAAASSRGRAVVGGPVHAVVEREILRREKERDRCIYYGRGPRTAATTAAVLSDDDAHVRRRRLLHHRRRSPPSAI